MAIWAPASLVQHPSVRADGTRLRGKTRIEYLDDIEAIVKQGIVDVMLVSASNLELLHERGVFKKSKVKPVIRANDTTDCWGLIRHGTYHKQASRPFRTASLPRVMYNAAGPVKGREEDLRHRSRPLFHHHHE